MVDAEPLRKPPLLPAIAPPEPPVPVEQCGRASYYDDQFRACRAPLRSPP